MAAPQTNRSLASIVGTLGLAVLLAAGAAVLSKLSAHSGSHNPRTHHNDVHSLDDYVAPSSLLDVKVTGARSTGDFTLIAENAADTDQQTPTDAVKPSIHHLTALIQSGPGIALWIATKQGLGVIQLPIKPGRAVYSAGRYLLTASVYSNSSGQLVSVPMRTWSTGDGKPLPAASPEPYRVDAVWNYNPTQSPDNVPLTGNLVLVPRDIESRAAATVTPLGADDQPCFPDARLRVQAAGNNLYFVRVPGGWTNQVKAFRVTIGDDAGSAQWEISNLPDSKMVAGDDEIKPLPTKIGTLTVSAEASEAPDQSFPWNPPSEAEAKTVSWSADSHYASGLPSLRVDVKAACSAPKGGDTWQVTVSGIEPQWSGKTPPAFSQPGGDDVEIMTTAPASPPAACSYSVGPVYPGQQKCAVVQCTAERMHEIDEPITLHDADLRYSRTDHRWMLQWERPQTITTPSGIVVAVFNRRILDNMSGSNVDPEWPAATTAELNLGVLTPQASTTTTVSLAAVAPYAITITDAQKDGWRALWLPGAPAPVRHQNRRFISDSPIFPYFHDGFSAVMLGVTGPQTTSPVPAVGDIPACTLPSHIDDLHLIVRTVKVAEKVTFTLIPPVRR